MATVEVLHVAVGVVYDDAGAVLIAKRPPRVHQGGLWEFPGGKLEPGENCRQALMRELREELDIEVLDAHPLIKIRHAYPDRDVMLEVWRVERHRGTAVGCEGQPVRWVLPAELGAYRFPEANHPIITAVRLPPHYAILNESTESDTGALVHTLEGILDSGVKLVQYRAKHLNAADYLERAQRIAKICRGAAAMLMVNGEPDWAWRIPGAGIHLSAERLWHCNGAPKFENRWRACSCHNLAELQRAEQLGFDFALLSPVQTTTTHPGAEPLGWDRFAAWVEQVNIPVYALGGMGRDDLDLARCQGAQGIAGISAFAEC